MDSNGRSREVEGLLGAVERLPMEVFLQLVVQAEAQGERTSEAARLNFFFIHFFHRGMLKEDRVAFLKEAKRLGEETEETSIFSLLHVYVIAGFEHFQQTVEALNGDVLPSDQSTESFVNGTGKQKL